eukprot:TRINITY_DN6981_c0_g1_i1.p1 TRINITY_DN6981_c0_g1~~TRINITY_DN6981_c0_g1_i1.p1  ORF type:complete len:199 (+),score=23.42 TRINITY_DN6981_c0_g1_i1:15-611(+)
MAHSGKRGVYTHNLPDSAPIRPGVNQGGSTDLQVAHPQEGYSGEILQQPQFQSNDLNTQNPPEINNQAPINYLPLPQKNTPETNNPQNSKQEWYIPLPIVHKAFFAIGRIKAEELLKNEKEGTYLFRPSSAQTTSGQPALATSYRYDQGVGHGVIYRVGRKFSGSENPGDIAYDSLDDMVSTLNYHIYPLQSGATIPK